MYCDKFLLVGRDNSMTTLAAYVLESGVKAKFSFRYPKCLNDSIPLKLDHGKILKEVMNDITEITKLIKKEGIKTICFQSNFISYNNNITIARMLRREFGNKIILVQGGQFFSEYKPAPNQLNLELINSLSSKDMKQPLSISGDLAMEEKSISHFFDNINWDIIKDLGLSFGLQSFNDKALKAVGRYSLFDVAKTVTDKYRDHEKITLDCCMIVGFPGQNISDFKEDVKTVVRELKIRPFLLHLICITNYLIENYRFDRHFQIIESDCITEEELKTFIDVTDPLMNKCMETCKGKCEIEKCVYLNSHW